jgi:tRNA/tmRNA/rRNA uracil-C5-methylase (TrmA/RlmC/RlmD family)
MRFRAVPITPGSLESLFPSAGDREETILLDPPRGGPGKGVISLCAERNASRIMHLFYDIDRIPIDEREWRRNGSRVS